MQRIRVEDAVGTVLMHDMTEIIPGKSKGPRFRKGHVVRNEDIPVLLQMGKQHIYVWDQMPGLVHEDEAAWRLATAVSGPGIELSAAKEGKITLKATQKGLIYVLTDALLALNCLEYISVSTLHSHRPVEAGQSLAGARVVPLMVEERIIAEAERLAASYSEPIIQVRPLHSFKIGIVTTGSEVYHGRIQDKFGPVLKQKVTEWGSQVIGQLFADDDISMIQGKISEHLQAGAEMILVSGGMSVDPDDVTPSAIKEMGAELVTYGSPVLPGAMFLLAYLDGVPILGLPGCVMYSATTVFDLIAPRLLTGEKLGRLDIARLGHGGLCMECPQCTYPHCGFGK